MVLENRYFKGVGSAQISIFSPNTVFHCSKESLRHVCFLHFFLPLYSHFTFTSVFETFKSPMVTDFPRRIIITSVLFGQSKSTGDEYNGGVQYTGDIMSTVVDTLSTAGGLTVHWEISLVRWGYHEHTGSVQYTGGYHGYTRGLPWCVVDIMSKVWGVQYTGGYHEYTKGSSVHWEYIMSSLGDVQYTWEIHEYIRGLPW